MHLMTEEGLKWIKGTSSFLFGDLAFGICLSVMLLIILEIRSRSIKAKTERQDYFLVDSLHWVLSPTIGKILIAPKENLNGEENKRDNNDDRSEVFYSVKSCFSNSSSDKELDCLGKFRVRSSIWEEFLHCEGSPLPNSPDDSWTWCKIEPWF